MKEDNKFWTNCIVPDCKKDTYGGSRGMCINHYSAKSFQVKVGNTTWEQLEVEGKAKPKQTKEQLAATRSHSYRKNKVSDGHTLITLDNVEEVIAKQKEAMKKDSPQTLQPIQD